MIKKSVHFITGLAFLLALLYGCLFPVMQNYSGYEISIAVSIISKDSIDLVRDILKGQAFVMGTEIERSGRAFIFYRKDIPTSEAKIEHPYIPLWISYNISQTTGQMTIFRIDMRNERDGQNPYLKKEMDRIADILLAELKRRGGEENITVERKATGPPF